MNILIVDDHPLVCSGIQSILISQQEINHVSQANDIQSALELMSKDPFNLAMVDMRLKGETGIDFILASKKIQPFCKYVILSSSSKNEDFDKAMEADVDGYILKDAFPEDIIYAVKTVLRGRKYFDPLLVKNIAVSMQSNQVDELDETLSPRETEILDCLGTGLSNKEIAQKLFISENTVKKHVSSILAKLNLSDRTQAALHACKYNR